MRLVIDLVARADRRRAGAAGAGAAPPPPPPPTCRRRSASRVSAIRTIAIDPGHGGDDEGVKGAGGTKEKDLTLAVARRVKAAIEARLGIRVLLTRDDDRNVPLDERTAMANNNKADLFISLHANASLRPAPPARSILLAAFDARRGAGGAAGARRARADLRRRLARHRARAVGSRADAPPRSVDGVRRRCSRSSCAIACRSPRARSSARRCACSSRRTCRRCSSRWAT